MTPTTQWTTGKSTGSVPLFRHVYRHGRYHVEKSRSWCDATFPMVCGACRAHACMHVYARVHAHKHTQVRAHVHATVVCLGRGTNNSVDNGTVNGVSTFVALMDLSTRYDTCLFGPYETSIRNNEHRYRMG